ncbi:putative cytochrome P450 [Nemania abortiva]|nr:putative cytochrome P450 [Nemania abortiva]
MAYISSPIIFSVIIALLAILSRKILQIGRRPIDLPPGPPTIPILGNLHLIPKHDAHLQFQKWAQEYGPVYSLILGTKTMIVFSSDHAIKDIMDKRSAISSDRMDMYIGQKIASGGLRLTISKIRRIMHDLLNVNSAKAFGPYQALENQQMMYDILNDPNNFVQHVHRYSSSLMTATTFGFRVSTFKDPHFKELLEVLDEIVLLAQTGLAALLDYLPILQMLPAWMLSIKQRAKSNHQKEKILYRYHWDKVKADILSSNPNPSFSVGLLREQKKYGFDDDLAAFITGTLLEAGTDTTANALVWFLCAMLVFPTVQERAKAEIDRTIGADRMPLPEDEPNLQYDDHYMGFRLPKGAILVNNVYTIHRDPACYPHPDQFDPDRFKDDRQNFYNSAVNPDLDIKSQLFSILGKTALAKPVLKNYF